MPVRNGRWVSWQKILEQEAESAESVVEESPDEAEKTEPEVAAEPVKARKPRHYTRATKLAIANATGKRIEE